MLLCASPDYLRRSGEPSTMDALSRHQAVGYLHAGAVLPGNFAAKRRAAAVQATGQDDDG